MGRKINPDTILHQGHVHQCCQAGEYVPPPGTAQPEQGRNIKMTDRFSQNSGLQVRARCQVIRLRRIRSKFDHLLDTIFLQNAFRRLGRYPQNKCIDFISAVAPGGSDHAKICLFNPIRIGFNQNSYVGHRLLSQTE